MAMERRGTGGRRPRGTTWFRPSRRQCSWVAASPSPFCVEKDAVFLAVTRLAGVITQAHAQVGRAMRVVTPRVSRRRIAQVDVTQSYRRTVPPERRASPGRATSAPRRRGPLGDRTPRHTTPPRCTGSPGRRPGTCTTTSSPDSRWCCQRHRGGIQCRDDRGHRPRLFSNRSAEDDVPDLNPRHDGPGEEEEDATIDVVPPEVADAISRTRDLDAIASPPPRSVSSNSIK